MRLDDIVKQMYDYHNKKIISKREKKVAEIMLASYGGSQQKLSQQIGKAEAYVLGKLDTLLGVDAHYLEQQIAYEIQTSTTPIQYGEYTANKGLVLAVPTTPPAQGTYGTVTRGNTLYQLTDQRGNVMVVISDKKIPHDDNHDGIIDYYTADVVKATDYSSFGAPLPGRTFEIAEYKYGYNGKENDPETGYQDYGLRMYDPNIGRFISPDPLTKAFPFYSPYQFAGNSPIKFIDLDGGEPKAANSTNGEVKKLGGDAIFRLWAIHGAYWGTGGDKSYFAHSETETKGNYVPVDNSKFWANSPGDKHNRYVNTNSQFVLTNENAFASQKDLVNTLLGDFVWGNGPENIVFPHNGKFSKSLSSSIMVGETLAKWSAAGQKDDKFGWNMDGRGEINVDVNSGFTSLEHFIGSAALRVTTQKDNTIKIEIFNVTSLTSGDINKDLPVIGKLYKALESAVRNGKTGSSQIEYSNQSQYFSFTLTQNEASKIIKQFSPAGNSSTPKKK